MNDCIVKVFAAEVIVSFGVLNLHDAILYLDKSNIKCAASKIEHKPLTIFVGCAQAIRHRCGNRLLEKFAMFNASLLSCTFSSCDLVCFEFGRDCDNCRRNIVISDKRFESLQNFGRKLLWRKRFSHIRTFIRFVRTHISFKLNEYVFAVIRPFFRGT